MACGDQTVDIGACDVSGTNNTGMNSNYVVQYPKPYRRTDGKWMALATIVGGVIGAVVNKDTIDKAHDAEEDWNDITDKIKDKGYWLIDTHAEKLLECNDDLFEMLCAIAKCGYEPDYEGIMVRAKAQATAEAEIARRKACRVSNRYNTGINANVYSDIAAAEIIAATTAMTAAVEDARYKAFEVNYKLVRQTAMDFENAYLNRLDMGVKYTGSTMNSYRALADSYRKTARDDASDWTSLATTLAAVLAILWTGWDERDPESNCGDNPEPTPTPTTTETPAETTP